LSAVEALGVDAARGGWVAAVRVDGRLMLSLQPTVAGVIALAGDAPVAIDMPIGLLERVEPRACDREARALLGERASTVFAPPSRPALAAATYAEARTAVPGAASLSAQAFGLAPRIREVDALLQERPALRERLFESHPELAFRRLAGGRVLPDKKSIAGHAERVRVLLPRLPGLLDALTAFPVARRDAEPADALDACAVLTTALSIARGEPVTTLGGERDADGIPMRIAF